VNQGNPYVSSGVIANSNGVVVGGLSRGAELSDIQQGFGIIKG
jgi:translation initiation factor 6 (eIF-6)